MIPQVIKIELSEVSWSLVEFALRIRIEDSDKKIEEYLQLYAADPEKNSWCETAANDTRGIQNLRKQTHAELTHQLSRFDVKLTP